VGHSEGLSRRVFGTQDEAITYARRITKRGDKKAVLRELDGERWGLVGYVFPSQPGQRRGDNYAQDCDDDDLTHAELARHENHGAKCKPSP
jgi:hypothetical protein